VRRLCALSGSFSPCFQETRESLRLPMYVLCVCLSPSLCMCSVLCVCVEPTCSPCWLAREGVGCTSLSRFSFTQSTVRQSSPSRPPVTQHKEQREGSDEGGGRGQRGVGSLFPQSWTGVCPWEGHVSIVLYIYDRSCSLLLLSVCVELSRTGVPRPGVECSPDVISTYISIVYIYI
jgi:hypothetical protein